MKNQIQHGRSMVEMLGVLAIIGVLSIGGIAGYTMAMNRYKANEFLDVASKISMAVQTLLASRGEISAQAKNDIMTSVVKEFRDQWGAIDCGEDWCNFPSEYYEVTFRVFENGYARVTPKSKGNAATLLKNLSSITGNPQSEDGGVVLFEGN